MVGTAIFLLVFVVALGVLYLRLHALPEHVAHRNKRIQFEVVCVLALLAMFTGEHLFWIMGLLLALIDFPDFSSPMRRIAVLAESASGATYPGVVFRPVGDDQYPTMVEAAAYWDPKRDNPALRRFLTLLRPSQRRRSPDAGAE